MNHCCCSGNRDYSPYLSLLSAIGFWGLYGCSEHWGYIDDLLAKGVELLVNEWGTESLVPESLSFRSMALVKLKDGIFNALSLSEAAERIQVGKHPPKNSCICVSEAEDVLHSESQKKTLGCSDGFP